MGLDCLVCIGGNGTLKTANLLAQEGLNVVGIPKTIDNDISYIDKFLELYNEIKNEVTPIIKGRDLINLGMEPGNYFGPILKQIFDAQLDEEFNNFEDGINWAKKKGII